MLTLFSVAVKTVGKFSFQVVSDTKVKRKGKTKQIFPSQEPIMKARDDDV